MVLLSTARRLCLASRGLSRVYSPRYGAMQIQLLQQVSSAGGAELGISLADEIHQLTAAGTRSSKVGIISHKLPNSYQFQSSQTSGPTRTCGRAHLMESSISPEFLSIFVGANCQSNDEYYIALEIRSRRFSILRYSERLSRPTMERIVPVLTRGSTLSLAPTMFVKPFA